ncbi:hypothetical protein C0Z19_00615 [Trinickia soli]|uniref:Uncharacterized protein n=1 Tax=Trinickia soli TaxID=380675 RepID=A0A2N7WFS9_9BURK|nr:hypothetical protein C0Z19_00615 [Trinickia soli]
MVEPACQFSVPSAVPSTTAVAAASVGAEEPPDAEVPPALLPAAAAPLPPPPPPPPQPASAKAMPIATKRELILCNISPLPVIVVVELIRCRRPVQTRIGHCRWARGAYALKPAGSSDQVLAALDP